MGQTDFGQMSKLTRVLSENVDIHDAFIFDGRCLNLFGCCSPEAGLDPAGRCAFPALKPMPRDGISVDAPLANA
jgi:hypothetical protein